MRVRTYLARITASTFIRVLPLIACTIVPLSSLLASAQQSAATKHVLVLYWYNKDYPWNVKFDETFQTALRSAYPTTVEYYPEYLESNRFPGEKQTVLLRDYLKQKYAERPVDVVVANSDTSLEFLLRYRSDLFPHTPIVFIATRRPTEEELRTTAGLTGIINISTHAKTLDLALKLHPDTEQLFVISGTLQHDGKFEIQAREDLRDYEGKLRISYLTDRPLDELIDKVKGPPKHSLVLYVWQQALNTDGSILESADILSLIAHSAQVPIYGMATPYLGKGIIGGYINTAEASANRVAEITLRIVNGEPAQNIPVENAPTVPMFDDRQLRRWKIVDRALPAGSIVQFKDRSVWQLYRRYIIAVLVLIVGQAALIGWLLAEKRKRQRAEEARLHLAAIVESSKDAIVGSSLEDQILSWNLGAEFMYGYSASEVLGRHISILVPAELREEFDERLKQRNRGEDIEDFETVRVKKDASRIDVSVSVSPIKNVRGQIVAYATIYRDISERKQADRAIRESEERFRTMADTAPVLIWMSGPDKLRTYFNRSWLEFTGRTMQEELGDGWVDGVHVSDRARCLDTYVKAFDSRKDFSMEYHLRRFDGDYRRMLDTGVPRFMPDGSFAGYIGSLTDISELKRAERELQRLTGQLIHLQDEERRRIAGELHDSLGQSLVIIKNRAMICMRDPTDAERISEQLEEISSTATSAIDDVHEIAHNLRPYELDRLGLAKAVETMIGKFANSSSIQVSADLDRIDGMLSPAAETSVYRIVQEGLNNVVKHAEATEAKVSLKQVDGRLIISVADNGKGISTRDVEVVDHGGFGLAGIAERARMLGGSSAVESQSGKGTNLIVTLAFSEVGHERQS